MSNSFFNTTLLSGRQLADAICKAKSQEAAILLIFKNNPRAKFTPYDVHELYKRATKKRYTPLTSIRRAMTALTQRGELKKLSVKKIGRLGSLNHKWMYNGEV